MVKVIMGLKGSGKTKQLIELVTKAVGEDHGDVVCLEKEPKLTFDIPYRARLIYTNQFDFGTSEFFKGFICGLRAANYDITHIFVDSLYKMIDDDSDEAVSELLDWLDGFSRREKIEFTITITADETRVPEGITKFF